MAIDIENPGAEESGLKGALRTLVGGWVPLASGIITTPQMFIDLDLPTEYIAFKISCVGILSDNNNFPCFALSADGGATYIIDNDLADAYKYYSEYHTGGSTAVDFEESTAGRGLLSSMWVWTGDRYAVDIQIDPGETDKFARISSHLWVTNTSLSFARIQSMPGYVTGRMNAIRLGSSNAFDDTPAAVNMIGGAYTLLGIVA